MSAAPNNSLAVCDEAAVREALAFRAAFDKAVRAARLAPLHCESGRNFVDALLFLARQGGLTNNPAVEALRAQRISYGQSAQQDCAQKNGAVDEAGA